ncbi:hypothetical protein SEA_INVICTUSMANEO_93 [Mycobacterium phage InvictusManeo]|nr:hypothetical protein SEA_INVICTUSMANEO_93 [Mycobacterium phage InvictusManeo]
MRSTSGPRSNSVALQSSRYGRMQVFGSTAVRSESDPYARSIFQWPDQLY